jgi:AcrR family transcriptional regulator
MSGKPTVLYHTDQASKTRQGILRIAVDIASAEGLESLSIGRLATELQMSKTGIFAHFGSKERLQLATVDAAKQVFQEQVVRPAIEHSRGGARLRAMLDEIAALTQAWLVALQDEIAFARSAKQIRSSVDPVQLAFELHAYVQEANWAFKLFNDKSAFSRARRAIASGIALSSNAPSFKKSRERKK